MDGAAVNVNSGDYLWSLTFDDGGVGALHAFAQALIDRRLRGTSSGDGLSAKRPALEAVAPQIVM